MSVQWVDIRDTKVRPMAGDMAELEDGGEIERKHDRRLSFWERLALRRRDPSRRTH